MHLVWSDRALLELDEIISYIKRDSPKNALLVSNRIDASAQAILAMPFLGRPIHDGQVRQHEVPKTGFLLLYAVSKHSVSIASVRRAKKLPG